MSLLGALARLFGAGAEDEPADGGGSGGADAAGEPGGTGAPETTGKPERADAPGEEYAGSEGAAVDVPSDPGALVGAFGEASGAERVRLGVELVDRAADEPAAFAPHADDLVELLGTGDTGGIAAAALGHLAEADPSTVDPHADDLLAALGGEDDMAREEAADALRLLARAGRLPVDPLLDRLADGSARGRREAATVLGVLAATQPGTLPVDRLIGVRADGDAVARGGAGYVLAVLAAETGVDAVSATEGAFVDLARDVSEAGVSGFVANELLPPAARLVVDREVPDAGCRRVEVGATPEGTVLEFHVEDRGALAGELGGDPGLRAVLEERLGITDPRIDILEHGGG